MHAHDGLVRMFSLLEIETTVIDIFQSCSFIKVFIAERHDEDMTFGVFHGGSRILGPFHTGAAMPLDPLVPITIMYYITSFKVEVGQDTEVIGWRSISIVDIMAHYPVQDGAVSGLRYV